GICDRLVYRDAFSGGGRISDRYRRGADLRSDRPGSGHESLHVEQPGQHRDWREADSGDWRPCPGAEFSVPGGRRPDLPGGGSKWRARIAGHHTVVISWKIGRTRRPPFAGAFVIWGVTPGEGPGARSRAT